MKLYLDSCCIQRPLDERSQSRISVEAEAILGLLNMVAVGVIVPISSDALVYELGRIEQVTRRRFALQVLSLATDFVELKEPIVARAQSYIHVGIKGMDALHVAAGVEGEADFFCTCDDRLLRRAREVSTSGTRVVSPIELVMEITE